MRPPPLAYRRRGVIHRELHDPRVPVLGEEHVAAWLTACNARVDAERMLRALRVQTGLRLSLTLQGTGTD